MSIEDKRLARLADEFANIIGRFSPTDRTDQSMALAARALELGADLPPEPQWKPRQVVLLRLEDGMPYLAKRVDSNDGWEVFGVDVVITDNEVTDVEPVAVLTADDVRAIGDFAAKHVSAGYGDAFAAGENAREAVLTYFTERGLDL